MGLFLPQDSLPHFILGYINKAFLLYSTVTKYGEEMTNALFPFIKLGPTAVFHADALLCSHKNTHTHILGVISLVFVQSPFTNHAMAQVHEGSLPTLSLSLTVAACHQTFVRG